jgi:PhnB protein
LRGFLIVLGARGIGGEDFTLNAPTDEGTEMPRATTAKRRKGYHTVTPVISVVNAKRALAFYKRVFDATVLELHDEPDGTVSMVTVRVGDSPLMISDESSEHAREHANKGWPRSPKNLNGTSGSLYVYLSNADTVFKRAVKEGAAVIEPMRNKEWGDRVGAIKDPFGHVWNIASHIRPMEH